MERVSAGYVETVNPYNARQTKRFSLLPENVDAFVFWTRDPRHILASADELASRGYPFYAMVTATGYPSALEPDMAPTAEVLAAMGELARKIGQERVIWRYDPILLTSITDTAFHRENFNSLAERLAGSVRRVIVSVYDEYGPAKRRLAGLETAGILRMSDTGGSLPDLLEALAKSAGERGMEIQSCAEREDYSALGIRPGACIDASLMKRLWGLELSGKDSHQRPDCLCARSVDIGVYGACAAHCAYCYARR